MDAKFYLKNLNNSSNGDSSKGVEGNQEGLLTIHTTPSYIHIIMSNEVSLRNKVIAIDDVKKSPIKDNLSINFKGILLYKEQPVPVSDLPLINYNSGFYNINNQPIASNVEAIKFKDVNEIPQEIKDEFGDYYIIKVQGIQH